MENLKSDTYSKEIKFNWNQGFAENLEPWPEPITRAQTIKYVRSYLDSEAPSFLSRNSNRITYIDLFCGGGGLSLGVHHALHKFGFDAKLLLAADKDKKALRLIQHHFKPMIHSDHPLRTGCGILLTLVAVKEHLLLIQKFVTPNKSILGG